MPRYDRERKETAKKRRRIITEMRNDTVTQIFVVAVVIGVCVAVLRPFEYRVLGCFSDEHTPQLQSG
jgi:hypothetical protein